MTPEPPGPTVLLRHMNTSVRKKGKVVFLDSVNIIQGTHDDKRNPKHDCLEQSRPNGCPYTKF